MKKLILILIFCLFTSSVWAGDLTDNGYFYLPAKGSYGTAERNYWLTILRQTDVIIKGMSDAIADLQANGGGGGGTGDSEEWDNDGSVIYSSSNFGNIGIGTSKPQYALDVSGSINGSAVKVNGTDVCLYGTDCGYASAGGWSDAGTSVYLTTTSDNVGIGTTNPAGKLHVSGGALVIEGAFSGMEMAYGQRIVGDTSRKISFVDTTGTYNEDLRVDIDTTSNTAAWDSTTGITTWSAPDFTFVTGGLKSATNLNVGSSYSSVQTAPTNGAIIQGNVGIGTFTPAQALHIIGNARISGLTANECVQTTTGGLLTTSGAACGSGGGGGGVGVGTVNPGVIGAIPFYTASTTVDDSPVMFTDGTNVGIGTTGPTAKLQVAGTVAATAYTGDGSALTGLPSSSGWSDGGSNVYNTTTTDRVGIGTTTPNATTSLEIVKQSSNQPFKISSAATTNGDYLTVTSAGNIGIGTINPVTKAVVSASDTTTYTATATTGATLSVSNPNTTVNNMAKVDFKTGNSASTLATVASITSVATDHTNGSEDGDLVVTTSLNGALTERVRVMNTGAVGIGTNSPVGALNVVGDELRVGNGGTNTNATSAGELYVQGDLEVDGTITGDGSGLINLASTSGGWSDGGTNVYTSTTTDTVGIGTTGASGTLEIVKQGSAIPFMVSATATGDGDYLVINSAGNIGIGTTTSLNQKLTVNGGIASLGTSAGSLVLNEAIANGFNTITVSAPSSLTDNRSCTLQDDSTPFDDCISAPSSGGGWVDGGSNIYQSTTSDNVGIGTVSPVRQLEISTAVSSVYPSFGVKNSVGESFRVEVNSADDSPAASIGSAQAINLDFQTNDTTYLSVSPSGNVGIGTTSPRSLLEVDKGTGIGQLTLDGTTGGCIMLQDTDGAGWTECDALNGVLTCETDGDGVCD